SSRAAHPAVAALRRDVGTAHHGPRDPRGQPPPDPAGLRRARRGQRAARLRAAVPPPHGAPEARLMEPPAAMLTLPAWLDLAGIAVFALRGALLATRLRMTMVTVIFFALVTGVGGGSVRDLLIGAPVFWVHDPWVAPVILL